MANIYDAYSKVTESNHSHNDDELKKILFDIVRKDSNSYENYSKEKGQAIDEYTVQIEGNITLKAVECLNYYIIVIYSDQGGYNYFGSEKFEELIKKF